MMFQIVGTRPGLYQRDEKFIVCTGLDWNQAQQLMIHKQHADNFWIERYDDYEIENVSSQLTFEWEHAK